MKGDGKKPHRLMPVVMPLRCCDIFIDSKLNDGGSNPGGIDPIMTFPLWGIENRTSHPVLTLQMYPAN